MKYFSGVCIYLKIEVIRSAYTPSNEGGNCGEGEGKTVGILWESAREWTFPEFGKSPDPHR